MQNQLTQTKSANILIVKDSSKNDLKTVLAYIYTLCGFEKMPDETQDMVLIGFIREHFSDLSLTDIKTAFELGISGETGVDMKHYHNFNSIYFSDVINAWKRYKINKKSLTPKLIESPEMSKEDKKLTHSKWLHSLIFPQIEKLNKGEIDEVTDYGNTLYNYLDKKFINYTRERKDGIKELAIAELLLEKRLEKVAKPENRNEIGREIEALEKKGKDTEGIVRMRSKCIALRIFLNDCKGVRDIISEIKKYENLS